MLNRVATKRLFFLLQVLVFAVATVSLVADNGGGGNGGGDNGGGNGGGNNGGGEGGVTFFGVVQSLPQGGLIGNWQVGGSTVQVSSSTTIDAANGAPAVGSCVEVEGSLLAGNSVNAGTIHTEDSSKCNSGGPGHGENGFQGGIQSLPAGGLIGDWSVSGKTIHVTTGTQIKQDDGPVSIGACVNVQGATNADGSISATEIEIQSAAGGCATAPRNQQTDVEFSGVVQTAPQGNATGNWLVSGRTVVVSASTELKIEGKIGAGSCVEVKGTVASDGSVTASRFEVASDSSSCQTGSSQPAGEVNFFGAVQSLPPKGLVGNWAVGGKTVQVTASTEIDTERGAIAANSCVEVEGQLQADNSIVASQVKAEESSNCAGTTSNQGIFQVEGILASIPAGGGAGNWTIAGQTVAVTSSTVLDTEHGPLVVGACVEAVGTGQTGGVLTATKIESRSAGGVCLGHEGLVSAASFSGISVVPGEIVGLFGFNMGPATRSLGEIESDGKVSRSVSGVHVFFDGNPAPLLFVSGTQINAVVPFSVAGKTTTEVQIENNGAWSDSVTIAVNSAAPAVFTLDQSGKGPGAILNFDNVVNGPSRPASRGSVIQIFATGAGQTSPSGIDGDRGGQSKPVLPVSVTIGGKEAEVDFAGTPPGLVAGGLQVNVRIPDDAPQGAAVPIVLKVGDTPSQDGVTVSIR